MAVDDEEDQQDNGADEATEDQTPDETPEEDPRDQRIAELEMALAAASAQVDALSQGLFASQVDATGRLIDPGSMPYAPELLNAPEALDAAITALLLSSPWMGKVQVSGDVDQDARDEVTPPAPNLLSILKEAIN